MTASSDAAFFGQVLTAATDDLDAVDREVIAVAAGRCLYDTLAGMSSEPASVGPSLDGVLGGESLAAASKLAIAAHRDDLDDVHWASMTHPGSFVWPALLAVWAEQTAAERPSVEVSGDQVAPPLGHLRRAAAFGYQVTVRLAEALDAAHRQRYHLAATTGTLGAVAAVGYLSGHRPRRIVEAMLHGASSAGHGAAAARTRSRTLVHHRATAAMIALSAVRTAHIGPAVRNPWSYYDEPALRYEPDRLMERRPPAVAQVTRRRHKVSGFAHCMVDAVQDLRRQVHDEASPEPTAWHLEVDVPEFVAAIACQDPGSAHDAAWHLPTIAASAWHTDGSLDAVAWPTDTGSAPRHPQVVIDTRAATPPDLAVTASLVDKEGVRLTVRRDVPFGHPLDPWPDDVLVDKACKATTLGVDRATRLLGRWIDPHEPVRLADVQQFLAAIVSDGPVAQ